ncbi:hypothetical protein CcCBS67573_g10050 [Chytriomyces confervae]|uniref:DJ-1/PfpI domain-containing protein n=1 Tax=Chytriomyces confervae TaxID=246404 RepID=A0A507DIS0_9FUNG|nr:hypothetical protein CcCBS67573_g10050 [Chytriomyces confervae]
MPGKMIVAMILFDGWELLDSQGPFSVLTKMASLSKTRDFEFITVAKSKATPTETVSHQPVCVDHDFTSCPQVNVMIIPGGLGTFTAAHDAAMLSFVKKQSVEADWVTSVCTGSSILAEAGLLLGRRATSNKAIFDVQARYGKEVQWIHEARFVIDGKFITASGVSAGLDMAFELGGRLFDRNVVEAVKKQIGYEPLSEGDDIFAKIHGRSQGWSNFLFSNLMTWAAPIVVPMNTRAPSSALTMLFAAKPRVLTVLLFPEFDMLDMACALEAFLGLSSTYCFELVAVNPASVEAGKAVQVGGDSASDSRKYSSVVHVACDRWIDGNTLPADMFPRYSRGKSVVYIPSVHASQVGILQSEIGRLIFQQLFSPATQNKDSFAIGSGKVVHDQMKLHTEKPSTDASFRGWDKTGRTFWADAGLHNLTAALSAVKELVGEKAVVDTAVSMEISPAYLPEGVHL